MSAAPLSLSRDEARAFLVAHLLLDRDVRASGADGVRAVLESLRCIQLDPLGPMGTNAEMVALARTRGLKRDALHTSLLPGHAFEHFAKERCLLPAETFPYYRDRAVETPWWRTSERQKRVSPALLEEVLAEVRERGPVAARDLVPRGRVKPLDWNGWKGTSSAATMALEILWTRCQVVVAGRDGIRKLFDVPERALPAVFDAPTRMPFEPWALRERVRSAGLLSTAAGPSWSMLRDAKKKASFLRGAIDDGVVREVIVEGMSRPLLAPTEITRRKRAEPDERMRILGPLDALIWDRALAAHLFDFDYVWEVYKPAAHRVWGWYVQPLLHRGRLVGRLEGTIAKDARQGSEKVLTITRLWRESKSFDEDALDAALSRHAAACGAARVRRGRRARRR